jgi:hypothetical protein
MPRPLKEIDAKQFEKLCGLQCTKLEICGWFDITDKTLESWCKRTYGKGFSETFEEKRAAGKISLRRAQYELALKGNATMLIWLGRNYLGQSEDVTVKANVALDDDGLSKSLREMAEELESDGD